VGDGAPQGDGNPTAAEFQPGIRTFLIADIRGYTAFTSQHGDEAAGRLATHFAAVTERVMSAHDGAVVELRGDEALAVFASARQAIRAAVALQHAFSESAAEADVALPIGIGLDAGEAVPVRGGFRGACLNTAARLCSLAQPGQVLATPEVIHLASLVEGTRFVPYGRVRLKGIPHPMDVIAIEASATGPRSGNAAPTFPPAQRSPRSARVRPTQSKTRLVLLAVVGAVVVLAAATIVGPSLLPRPAESNRPPATGSAGGDPPTPALRATVVLVPDFQPEIWTPQYSMPDGGTSPPDLAPDLRTKPAITSLGSQRYVEWHEQHGGISQGRQTVRLVLTGQTSEPVIITQIHPVIIERKPPLTGWWFLPEQGGGVRVRFVEVNLDCPEHPAVLIVPDPKTGQITRRTTSIDLRVSRSDVEELEVTVFTSRSYVRWGLEITYVADGEVQTLEVTHPRLRVNGEAVGTLRTYTYLPVGTSGERTGLVRTPRYDTTRQTLRRLDRSHGKLCR